MKIVRLVPEAIPSGLFIRILIKAKRGKADIKNIGGVDRKTILKVSDHFLCFSLYRY